MEGAVRERAKLVEVPQDWELWWRRWKVFSTTTGEELEKVEYEEEQGEKVEV